MSAWILRWLLICAFLAPVTGMARKSREDLRVEEMKAGRAALKDGLYDLARKYFKKALKRSSRDADKAEAVLYEVEAMCGEKQFAEALKLLEKRQEWADEGGLGAGFQYWKARAHFSAGMPAVAATVLDSITVAPGDPYSARILRLRIKCYLLAGEKEQAIQTCRAFHKSYSAEPEAAANLLDWAGLLIDRERKAEAAAILKELVSGYPDSSEARTGGLWLGRILIAEKDWTAATNILVRVVTDEEAPLNLRAEASYTLARAYEVNTNWSDAVAAVKAGMKLARDPRLRNRGELFLARLGLRTGMTEETIPQLRKSIRDLQDDPLAAQTQIELAETLLDLNRFEESLREFQNYLDAFDEVSGKRRALMGKGWALFELARYAESAAAFEKAYTVLFDPVDKAQALFKMADAEFANGQYSLARATYLKVEEEFPDTSLAPQARFQAAECSARLDDFLTAEEVYKSLREFYPGSPFAEQALLQVALLKEKQGLWQEALAAYETAMAEYPDGLLYVRALHGRGLARYRVGMFSEALEDFERIVMEYTSSEFAEQAFYMRGWCLYLLGKDQEALKLCEDFIQLYPGSAWAADVLFWLAEYYYNIGNYSEAEKRFAAVGSAFPGVALADDAFFWAGRSAARQQEYLRAIRHYNKLTEGYPQSPIYAEARFAQGDALSELGEFASAILAFEEIIKSSPDSVLVDSAWGRKGDCQFTLGSDDPERYKEAIASYRAVISSVDASPALKLQAEFKVGRCQEKTMEPQKAFEHYMNVVYQFLAAEDQFGAEERLWFTRAAFRAGAIKEAEGEWGAAARIYGRIRDARMPASDEAEKRIQRIREEHWMSF